MLQRIKILPAVLAWACLLTPWQICQSDCRSAVLQPFAHSCHVVEHLCCDHRGATLQPGDAAGKAVAPARVVASCLNHGSGNGDHQTLLLQQFEPELQVQIVPPTVEPMPEFDAPMHRDGLRRWHPGRIATQVDPPGRESRSLSALRSIVLLL